VSCCSCVMLQRPFHHGLSVLQLPGCYMLAQLSTAEPHNLAVSDRVHCQGLGPTGACAAKGTPQCILCNEGCRPAMQRRLAPQTAQRPCEVARHCN